MEVALVRHACAGRKRDWSGPDERRPLDAVGQEQAVAIAAFFVDREVARIVASPAARCAQTLRPLADGRGLPVHSSRRLGPLASSQDLLDVLTDKRYAASVLCTHGEAMADLLVKLADMRVAPNPSDRRTLLQKGAVWLLGVEPGVDPRIVSLDCQVPAGMRRCEQNAFRPSRPTKG